MLDKTLLETAISLKAATHKWMEDVHHPRDAVTGTLTAVPELHKIGAGKTQTANLMAYGHQRLCLHRMSLTPLEDRWEKPRLECFGCRFDLPILASKWFGMKTSLQNNLVDARFHGIQMWMSLGNEREHSHDISSWKRLFHCYCS